MADVGCGPGHLTALLHEEGLDAFGLDLSPAMVEHARRAHPALRFDEASMEALPVEDGALGGVLAHYSMIHTPPGELPALLAEQVRVLAPGGLLLVSFFATDGPEPVRFDHKVAPAYSWPMDRFAELVTGAGLVTFARLLHDPASERGFLDAHLLARPRLDRSAFFRTGRRARACSRPGGGHQGPKTRSPVWLIAAHSSSRSTPLTSARQRTVSGTR